MWFGSHMHHHTLTLSVSLHCIAVFLARVVLLVITSRYLYREGKKVIRELPRRQDRRNAALKKAVAYLSVWLPIRLMCPGLLLRLGKWTCGFTSAVLPESLDVFNKACKSSGFWLLYGWTEIFIFVGVIGLIWYRVNWQNYIKIVSRMLNHLGFGSSTPNRRRDYSQGSLNSLKQVLENSTSQVFRTAFGEMSSTTSPGSAVKKTTSRRLAENPDYSSDSSSTDIEDVEVVPRATVLRRTRPKTKTTSGEARQK